MDFSASILNNIQKIKEEVNKEIVGVATKLFTYAVDYSPTPKTGDYSKGLFVNQWYPQQNGYSQEHSSQKDDNGSDSRSRISSLLGLKTFLGKDGSLSFTNSTAYAEYVEDLGWEAGEGTNGWVWTGKVAAYAPAAKSLTRIKSEL